MEAFSDGVIAVAITLLVLNLTVPTFEDHTPLAKALGEQWQEYLAYAISFITIGIIWINHHAMISRLRQTDHAILMLNLVLLMFIAVLPFATRLLTEALKHGDGETLAAAIYAGAFLLMSLAFSGLNRYILMARPDLMRASLSQERRRQILTRGVTGLVPYAIAVAVAPLSPYATVVICGLIALFYALPIASSDGESERD
jgi:uncharacterized membrane protein